MKYLRCLTFLLPVAGLIAITLAPAGCDQLSFGNAPVPVGVAKIDITPENPVHLVNELEAYESEGIEQRLFAKALAFGGDAGADPGADGPAVLLSFDGIGIPAHVADEVAARLREKRGIPRERVAVCATHTHWAPHLKGLLPNIFGDRMPPEHQARIDEYTEQLIDGLETAALKALDSRQPARLNWAVGKATFAVNRRLEGDGRIVTDDALMFTYNPDAPVDHTLPILCVRDLEGKLRAVHFTYACHAVSITGREISKFRNRIHSDWPGLAQELIEQRHPECVALATIGCAGDARPSPVGGIAVAEAQAREIADELDVLLASESRWRPLAGPIACRYAQSSLPLEPAPEQTGLKEFVETAGRSRSNAARGLVAQNLLAGIDEGNPPPAAIPFSVQSWGFGDDLAMIFLAGEVVVDYRNRIHQEFDSERLWVVAYANDTPCYIVSKRMLERGGYEAGNSMFYYGWLGPLKDEAEDRVMEEVRNVLPLGFHTVPGANP